MPRLRPRTRPSDATAARPFQKLAERPDRAERFRIGRYPEKPAPPPKAAGTANPSAGKPSVTDHRARFKRTAQPHGVSENQHVQIEGSNPVLAVHDLERSAEWYCRVLGCTRSDPDPGNWVFCTKGAVTFMLGRCPDVPPASSLGDHSYVAYLVVDTVDDFYANA